MEPTPQATPEASEGLLVVCLCAEWCRVCGEYRDRYAHVGSKIQTHTPDARFLWIDVEDEADLLDPIDVDDFPTLLLATHGMPRFFGVVTPQAQALERIVQTVLRDRVVLTDPALAALLKRICVGHLMCDVSRQRSPDLSGLLG